jgi:hypothetical protein
MNTTTGKTTGRRDRVLIVIVSVIAVLILTALAVVFLRGDPKTLDESTPAGVVQRYSTAVIEGDTATARSYLTDTAESRCSRYYRTVEASRIVLVSTSERADSATVRVSIVNSYSGGPFGPSESEREEEFQLLKVGGKWMVDQAPYPLMNCGGTPVKP